MVGLVERMVGWCDGNYLLLNTTALVSFSNTWNGISVRLQGTFILGTEFVKLLILAIDHNLKFNYHCRDLSKKLGSSTYAILNLNHVDSCSRTLKYCVCLVYIFIKFLSFFGKSKSLIVNKRPRCTYTQL